MTCGHWRTTPRCVSSGTGARAELRATRGVLASPSQVWRASLARSSSPCATPSSLFLSFSALLHDLASAAIHGFHPWFYTDAAVILETHPPSFPIPLPPPFLRSDWLPGRGDITPFLSLSLSRTVFSHSRSLLLPPSFLCIPSLFIALPLSDGRSLSLPLGSQNAVPRVGKGLTGEFPQRNTFPQTSRPSAPVAFRQNSN